MTVFWRFSAFCLVAAAALNHSAALARANQPLEDIMDIARDVATTAAIARGYDDVMVSIRPLDSRLAPAMCDEPLQALSATPPALWGPSVLACGAMAPSPGQFTCRAQ